MRMPSDALRKSLAAEIQSAAANLPGSPGLDYLISRGITAETAEQFQLGYDNNSLTIPYLTPAGPWTVKRRCIANHNCKDIDGHSKYMNTPGVELHLFNAQTLLTATSVVVTEGELDAVTAEQHGIPAVAFPGAQAWTKHRYWGYCFDSVDDVTVVADGDEPGRKAAEVVVKGLRELTTADVRLVVLPDGEDVNSLVRANGESVLLEVLGWL